MLGPFQFVAVTLEETWGTLNRAVSGHGKAGQNNYSASREENEIENWVLHVNKRIAVFLFLPVVPGGDFERGRLFIQGYKA